MFADLTPPVYLFSQGSRHRLPALDMSEIPHCSSQNATDESTPYKLVSRPDLVPILSVNTPNQPCSSSLSSPTSPTTPDYQPNLSDSKSHSLTAKGKGTGKGKNKAKASELLMSKTKYEGVNTRFRAKKEQASRESMKSSFEKLVNTGRDLSKNPEQFESSDPDQPSQPLIGDFSSHDLIHSGIADPPSFDEQTPQEPPPDEIVVITNAENVPRTETENVNSRWNFSINPLSFF